MASGPTQSPIELDVKCAADCRASERHEVIVMACLARAADSRKLSFGDNSDADAGVIRGESFMNGCVSAWSPRRLNRASTRRSLWSRLKISMT